MAAPFDHFLGKVATGLGNFVVPAGLRVHQISSLSIVACLSLSRRRRANCRISSDWTHLISSEWDHPISG